MSQDNRLDPWLKRIGYISQIGTLIVMVITIFYTVIPLYKTASLEESILIKENELKKLKLKIKNFEKKERNLYIANYTRTVSLHCTSLLKPVLVPLPSSIDDEVYKIKEPNNLNQNIESCLKKSEYTDIIRNNLSEKDKITFDKEFNLFIDKIGDLRQKKISEYYKAESDLKASPKKFITDNSIDTSTIESLNNIGKALGVSDEKITNQWINSVLSRFEAKLENDIRGEIYNFRNIDWQDNEEVE